MRSAIDIIIPDIPEYVIDWIERNSNIKKQYAILMDDDKDKGTTKSKNLFTNDTIEDDEFEIKDKRKSQI